MSLLLSFISKAVFNMGWVRLPSLLWPNGGRGSANFQTKKEYYILSENRDKDNFKQKKMQVKTNFNW